MGMTHPVSVLPNTANDGLNFVNQLCSI